MPFMKVRRLLKVMTVFEMLVLYLRIQWENDTTGFFCHQINNLFIHIKFRFIEFGVHSFHCQKI